MFNVREITDKDLKQAITLEIMNALPKWFSPPEDIVRKAVLHREYPFFAAYDAEKAAGFVCLKIHNRFTIDIFNLGVLERYHRQGIGHKLLSAAEAYAKTNDYKVMTVKTLDCSAVYEPYNQTRAFYAKEGFIPLEVFPAFWDEENPCLFLAKYIG